MRALLSYAVLVAVSLSTACAAESVSAGDHGRSEGKSLGHLSFPDGSCSAEEQRLIRRAFRAGKEAVQSDAFASWVKRHPYWPCIGDPGVSGRRGAPPGEGPRVDRASLDLEGMADRAIELARHPSDLEVSCIDDDGAWGRAHLGSPEQRGPERVLLAHQLLDIVLDDRPCTTGAACGSLQACVGNQCGEKEAGWTMSLIAGVLWHEVMHQRGYTHAWEHFSVTECGYEESAGYENRYSMNGIVGQALETLVASPCLMTESCEGGFQDASCGRPFRSPDLSMSHPLAFCESEAEDDASATREHIVLGLTDDGTGRWRRIVGSLTYQRLERRPGVSLDAYGEAGIAFTAYAKESSTGRLVGAGRWQARGEEGGFRRDDQVCRRWGRDEPIREFRIRPIPDCGHDDGMCHRVCLSDEEGGCDEVCLGEPCDGRGRPGLLRDMRCSVDAATLDLLREDVN